MALTRRPRHGDVVQFNYPNRKKIVNVTIGFATDDGLARDEGGSTLFIWGFNNNTELNKLATIIEEGPDVPDERSSLDLLHDGSPYVPKGISEF